MTATMETGAHRGRSGRLSPLAVLFAVAALLIQALVPAAALAAKSIGAVQVELCTPDGPKTVVLGQDGKIQQGFAGLPCHDCLGATLAVTETPELSIVPIAYGADPIVRETTVEVVLRGARAPPRPPGQGPPFHTL